MLNLRAVAERDLGATLEGECAMEVHFTPPSGVPFTRRCQVLYDLARMDLDRAERLVINAPVVTARRSSLPVVPEAGQTWLVKIPEAPVEGAPLKTYCLSPMRAPEGGGTIGFIRLYLQAVEQS